MAEVLRTVGRYEIVGRLGRGGMAVVHLARQTELDRLVALKELSALDAEDPSYSRRFLRESRLAGSLSHPNIVTVLDYFEHEGTAYIAMEYVEGGSLRPYLGCMTLAQIAGVLEGVLAALVHAEEQGIVHRDLKPENVLIAPDGRPKIADFGIAKAVNQVTATGFQTATGMTVGTPAYMAPEQAAGGEIGPWTDLYAVGCMTYEFFMGNVPFSDSGNPMMLLVRRFNEPIPPTATANPALPLELSHWIDALLARDPGQRTRSAATAFDDLEDIVIGLLGARWRRVARLPRSVSAADKCDPLALAPGVSASSRRTSAPAPARDDPAGDDARLAPTDASVGHGEAPPAPSGLVTPPPDDAVGPPWTPPPRDAVSEDWMPAPDDELSGPEAPAPRDGRTDSDQPPPASSSPAGSTGGDPTAPREGLDTAPAVLETPPPDRPSRQTPPRSNAGAVARLWRRAPRRFAAAVAATLVVLLAIGGLLYVRSSVYFLGLDTRDNRTVAIFRGLPYEPLGIELYERYAGSGVTIDDVPRARRSTFTDHKLRSREDADALVIALERGEIE